MQGPLTKIDRLEKTLNRQSEMLAEALKEKNDALEKGAYYRQMFNKLGVAAVGRALELKVGDDIILNILPGIVKLKTALAWANELLDKKTKELEARLTELEKLRPMRKPKFREQQVLMCTVSTPGFAVKITKRYHTTEDSRGVWRYIDTVQRDWEERQLRPLTSEEKGNEITGCGHADEQQCDKECT